MSSIPTSYGDHTVLITDLFIKIYKYYFPLGTSKTIFFNQIDHIVYHPAETLNPMWGPPSTHLNNWFPLDELRKYKKGFFQINLKNKAIRPSFSPTDPEAVFQVLWSNHSVQAKQQQKLTHEATNQTTKAIGQESKEKMIESSEIQIQSAENQSATTTIQKQFTLFGVLQKKVSGERLAFRDLTNKDENEEKLQIEQKNYYLRHDDDISLDDEDDSELCKQNNMLVEEEQFENLS